MMKKYIILLVFAFVAFAASAQVPANSTIDFGAGVYYEYTGLAGDTALNGTTHIDVTWKVARNDLYLYRVEAEMDEISGSATGIVILQGSMNGSDFFEIDTLTTVAGVEALSADGTVAIQDLTTGVAWRYMKALGKISTTGKWDLNYLRFRAVGKNE